MTVRGASLRGGRCLGPLFLMLLIAAGCGTTRNHDATEQLVLSDAVDRSISTIDFRPLSGRKVYLDGSYLRTVKGLGFVNADYVTSALRQQILAAGCLLQDSSKEAELVIEARIGALGADDHRMTYGLPENNAITTAANLLPNAPTLPAIPEIAFARREAREAAAKIAAFAYDRETRQPVWQSGLSQSTATARDTWVLGVGPFRAGTIRDSTSLAGSGIKFGRKDQFGSPPKVFERPPVDYTASTRFDDGWPVFNATSSAESMLGTPIEDIPEELIPSRIANDAEADAATGVLR
ncbi:MAG: DUF6655 family protein [Planctomycetota bacterium]